MKKPSKAVVGGIVGIIVLTAVGLKAATVLWCIAVMALVVLFPLSCHLLLLFTAKMIAVTIDWLADANRKRRGNGSHGQSPDTQPFAPPRPRRSAMSQMQFSIRTLLAVIAAVGIGAALWVAEPSWYVGAIEALLLAWVPGSAAALSVHSEGGR